MAVLPGAELRGAVDQDTGEVLAARVVEMMRGTGVPNGLIGLGFGDADIPKPSDGARARQRLLANLPAEMARETPASRYRSAVRYW